MQNKDLILYKTETISAVTNMSGEVWSGIRTKLYFGSEKVLHLQTKSYLLQPPSNRGMHSVKQYLFYLLVD